MFLLAAAVWTALAPGVELAALRLEEKPALGDGLLHVVRIDPARAQLVFGLAARDGGARTAAQWADQRGFVAVINAGMFEPSGRTTGLLRDGAFKLTPAWNAYKSALGFGPGGAALVDLDAHGGKAAVLRFPSVVQNLRLIRSPGEDVWAHAAPRRWSEAAIAADAQGRILFLFSRTPFTMSDFDRRLLGLDLRVVRAMHVEGGPEASLSVRGPLKLDLCGSYETGFHEDDLNAAQWPIPNVIGVRRLAP